MKKVTDKLLKIARKGRHGDTELAHITKNEATLLEALGGAGTTNPKTGLKEYHMENLNPNLGIQMDDNGNIMPGTYWYYHQDMPEGHYGDDINAYNELVEEQEWEDWTTSDGDGMQEVEDMLAAYYDTDWGGDYDSVGDIDFADMGDEEIHILEDGSGATMSHAGTEELKRLLTQIRDGSKQEKWVAARVLATIAMNKAGKRRPENWSADYADMDIYDEEYDNKDLSDSDRDLIQAWENDVQVLIDELLKSDGDNELTDISELELSIEQQGELDQALIDYNDIINTTKQKQGETEESIVEAFNTIDAKREAGLSQVGDIGEYREKQVAKTAGAGQILTPELKEHLVSEDEEIAKKQVVLEDTQQSIRDKSRDIGAKSQPGPDGIWGTDDDIIASGFYGELGEEGYYAYQGTSDFFDHMTGERLSAEEYETYAGGGWEEGVWEGYFDPEGDMGRIGEDYENPVFNPDDWKWVGPTGYGADIQKAEDDFWTTGESWFEHDTDVNAKFDLFWSNLASKL